MAKKCQTNESIVWKNLMKNKHKVDKHIHWKLNSGTSYFWWDDWLGVGPMVNHLDIERPGNINVANFSDNRNLNEHFIRMFSLPLLVPKILSTQFQFQFQETIPDKAIWNPSNNGTLSCSSAWDIMGPKKLSTKLNLIWNKHIPFKISYFLWRALKCKLFTNERLVI